MKPASVLLESTPEPAPKAASAPAFLVDLPAWHTVFFRNLFDLFRPGQRAPFKRSSPPGSFWPDVFVTSRLPWSRFALSVLGHVAAIAAIWGFVQFRPQNPKILDTPTLSRAEVIYYSPSEYLPPLDTGGPRKTLPQKGEPEYAPQAIISVPPEADNRSQTIVTPSDVKLNHDVQLPNIVAWSQTLAQPAVPLASTTTAAQNLRLPALPVAVVAPAPEAIPANRQPAPTLSQAVVAPAPEVNLHSSARTLQGPQASIFEPGGKTHLPRRSSARIPGADGNAKWKSTRHFCRDSGRKDRCSGHPRHFGEHEFRQRERFSHRQEYRCSCWPERRRSAQPSDHRYGGGARTGQQNRRWQGVVPKFRQLTPDRRCHPTTGYLDSDPSGFGGLPR